MSASRSSGKVSPLSSLVSSMTLGTHDADGGFDEIAHHRFHISADVADLRVLRRLDFNERRADQLASRRAISVLPTPVGPIMRMFFGMTSSRISPARLLAAIAIAQRHRDRAFCCGLADDVAIQFGDDGAWGE